MVYAHDEAAVDHNSSARLLAMALEGKFQGLIAEQNVIELYRIITNRTAMRGNALTATAAINLINAVYLAGGFQIVYPTRSSIDKVLQLAAEGGFVSARIFDVRLATLVLDAAVDYFATYNISDFHGIAGLNPLTPEQILTVLST
ncbi:hypothetical protein [[Phormidium] sp. ETS-05]|uniref:type II toxin-antitoxin system VapC family toxin n=1 Tax=[Phormidium] sp. ETS-05 TaxID=222819 RepID=UPI0018EEF745|nr:hypothetical protein [[Phormidium] sp. ETS-05]